MLSANGTTELSCVRIPAVVGAVCEGIGLQQGLGRGLEEATGERTRERRRERSMGSGALISHRLKAARIRICPRSMNMGRARGRDREKTQRKDQGKDCDCAPGDWKQVSPSLGSNGVLEGVVRIAAADVAHQ